MKCRQYSFAGLNITLRTQHLLDSNIAFSTFERNTEAESIECDFIPVSNLEKPDGDVLYKGNLFDIVRTEDGYVRVYSDFNGNHYAWSCYDEVQGKGQIYYLSDASWRFRKAEDCFKYIGISTVLLSRNRMLFHASLIESAYGGILFSGPSGIGKSTQADLWVNYRGAEQINGDRPVVYQENGLWMASGSPYAGSSNCYVNKQIPIQMIVFLEQSSECRIQSLNSVQIFRKIYEAAVMNMWNRNYMNKIVDLAGLMAVQIPCCLMQCTPDIHAVEMLEKWLICRRQGADYE